MPDAMPTVNPLALLLMFALMASVVGAWIWAILRLAFGAAVLPSYTPHLVPWGAKSVLAVILVWLAVQVGGQLAFLYAVRGTIARPPQARVPFTPAEMMTASAVQNAAVLVVILLLLGFICRARLRDFGTVGKQFGRQVLQGVVTWPLIAPVVYGMMLAAVAIWGRESHPLETAIQNDATGSKAIIFVLAGAVLAPAAEELIFRGVILGWLTTLILQSRVSRSPEVVPAPAGFPAEPLTLLAPDRVEDFAIAPITAADDAEVATLADPSAPPRAELEASPEPMSVEDRADFRTGPAVTARLMVANIAVSLLFGSLHYTVWPTPVPIFFLSLALGTLYQRTGSLVAPVTLHMTFNGISTILMFLTMGMNAPHDPARPPNNANPTPIPKPVDPITQPPIARLESPAT